MAGGCPLLFLVGAGICWARLVYTWRSALKFKVLPPGVKPRTIHRFMEDFDVEIASRIGRVWDEEGVLDPTALDLAENVLRVGAWGSLTHMVSTLFAGLMSYTRV